MSNHQKITVVSEAKAVSDRAHADIIRDMEQARRLFHGAEHYYTRRKYEWLNTAINRGINADVALIVWKEAVQ